jgi:hypothetical protein
MYGLAGHLYNFWDVVEDYRYGLGTTGGRPQEMGARSCATDRQRVADMPADAIDLRF